MKHSRILRILVTAIILSLLMVAIPALPVQAATISLDPDKGPPGTLLTVTGIGFTSGSLVDVRFDGVSKGFVQLFGTSTTFTKSFTVPQKDPAQYVVIVYDWSGEVAIQVSQAIFTITGTADIIIDPEKGTVGSEVEIQGEGFDDGERIEVFWDDLDDELDIEDGDDETDNEGEFFDTLIFIPESPAGTHTIIVKGRTSETEAEAEFTVEPQITIDPTSGSSGTKITVSGTGFGKKNDITITFNNVKVSISGDDESDRDGSFTTTFTVPGVAPGAYDVEVEDEDNNDAKAGYTIAGKISINPVNGNIGSKVTVTGTGFKPSGAVVISYDNIQVATVTADIGGAFSASFPVPKSTRGSHAVTASDGTNSASATFEAQSSASISQTTGNVGTELTFSGTGFSGEVTIKYDDKVIVTTTADAGGAFSATFTIPKSTTGNHTITASDGTNAMKETFTMESEAPAAPDLLLPEADDKAEATPSIDWKDADDPSLPVTYTLQIATDREFTEESIVLQKTGLTDSGYTLTEAEKLESVKKEAPYYWRVKATDGASNESDWSKPRSFHTGSTFSMSGWVLYLVIALGAFAIFVFGLWVGRRTAYY